MVNLREMLKCAKKRKNDGGYFRILAVAWSAVLPTTKLWCGNLHNMKEMRKARIKDYNFYSRLKEN